MRLILGTALAAGFALTSTSASAADGPRNSAYAQGESPQGAITATNESQPATVSKPSEAASSSAFAPASSSYSDSNTYSTPIEAQPASRFFPGYSVSLGGGVFGYASDEARDVTTNVGGTYTARLTVGTREPLGLEVDYLGSAQNISALGLAPDAHLISNGVQAALRINLGDGMIQPYLLGGAAYRHFYISNAAFNTSSVLDSDNVWDFPVGVGLEFHFGDFLLNARGDYRFATSDNLLSSLPSSPGLNSWETSLAAGVEF
jgi:hypothetical protein